MHEICSIILAAGKGTRMKSIHPKVLHQVAGKPMLGWVVDSLAQAGVAAGTFVLSSELKDFETFLEDYRHYNATVQAARQGTGDAVAAAGFAFAGVTLPSFARGQLLCGAPLAAKSVIICAGDTPALDPQTLARFIQDCQHSDCHLGVLGMQLHDPKGYGRCLTQDGKLIAIIEEKDATPEQRSIRVCNSGVIWARTPELFSLLEKLTPNNAQSEYYLTDCVSLAAQRGLNTKLFVTDDWESFAGVNDRRQLAEVESFIIRRHLQRLMLSGVTLHLPQTIYIEPQVRCGAESEIEPHVYISGQTDIGQSCYIGHGSRIENARIGDGASIGPGCTILGTEILPGERLPPSTIRIA